MANVLGELFGDIASAIREKTGDAEKMKPAEFPEKISAIETGADVSAVTAEAEDVLEGKTIVDASGNPVAGAMVNHGSVLKNLYFYENYPQNTYTIPKGYHDGTGKVKAEYSAKTITPTKNEQTVRGNRVGQGAPIIYDFLGKVTVKPIPDQYQDVTPVTATAEDVRAGKVFVDAQGNAVEGALSGTIADVSGVTATAADVRQGKVIVDAQGKEVVGTLEVQQKAPDVIWVGKDSVSNALVGTGVVRYVTFMNDDGTAVYGQKSVLVGTDCIEPVAGGYMDAPTKESTAEHTFTFSGGWATEPGSGINADALKNVTEDRTVYANFIAAVRYYTITYYDSDGTTVLKTESLAYGATPSYEPSKEGYVVGGWLPEITAVTGDASYTVQWEALAGLYFVSKAEGIPYSIYDFAITNDGKHVVYTVINTRLDGINGYDTSTEVATSEVLNPNGIKYQNTIDMDYNGIRANVIGGTEQYNSGRIVTTGFDGYKNQDSPSLGNLYAITCSPTTGLYCHSYYANSQYNLRFSDGNKFALGNGFDPNHMRITKGNKYLICADYSDPIRVYDISKTSAITLKTSITPGGSVQSLAVSSDGTKMLFATSSAPYVTVYSLETFEKICDFGNFLTGSTKATFVGDLVVTAQGSTVRAFEIVDSAPVEYFNIPSYSGGSVKGIESSHNCNYVAIYSDSSDQIEVWGKA